MEEFYPMPAFATLMVKDIAASKQWYQDVLGFRIVYEAPAPLFLVHLRRERYQDILLLPARPGTEITPSASLILNFDAGQTSIAAMAEAVRTGGAHHEGPVERPWNVRELTVYDPDGYMLKFTEPLSLDRKFEDIMSEAMKATE
ncbi:MAG TPA: VOC family protein [Chloroflexia bacterium]|nr:VOC family protein [Chloroflexia bacterium]